MLYTILMSPCVYMCACVCACVWVCVCVFECSQDVCGHMSMGVHVYVCTYIHVFVEA